MKKTFQKVMSCIVLFAMLFSLAATMAVGVSAVVADTLIGNVGAVGDGSNLKAYYNTETFTLTIRGSGAMKDYIADNETNITRRTNAPWHELALGNTIKSIVLEPGVTTIGNAAFYGVGACTSYSLPLSLSTIGQWAFGNNVMLTSITIPSGVTLIESYAFEGTSSLLAGLPSVIQGTNTTLEPAHNDNLLNDLDAASKNRVQIPANGELSGGVLWSFNKNNGTLSFTTRGLGGTVTMPDLDAFAQPWYYFINNIYSVTVANDIINVGDNALKGALNVSSVTLGEDVTTIGSGAFAGCTGLNGKTIRLPVATKTIESYAFDSVAVKLSTPNAQSVMQPGFNTSGNAYVTWDYGTLTGESTGTAQSGTIANGAISWAYTPTTGKLSLSLSSGYTSAAIPDYSFASPAPWNATLSSAITSIEIGSGITAIGDFAFFGLSNLSSVDFGGVYAIGESAFFYCTGLKYVAIPASVYTVEKNAFSYSGLIWATKGNASMQIAEPNTELNNALNASGGSSTTPGTSGQIANNSISWEFNPYTGKLSLSLISGYTTTAIPDFTSGSMPPWYTTDLASKITSIEIGSGITAIGDYAFYGLTKVVTVDLGSVQYIDQYAFFYCTGLTSVTLPATLLIVGSNAFSGCSALTYAVKRNSATIIQDTNTELNNALNNTTGGLGSTTSGKIASDTIQWTYDASSGTLTFALVSGYYGTASIPDYSYGTAPWYTTTVRAGTRYLKIGNGITGIGDYAFYGMTNISVMDLGAVRNINEGAFSYCTALTSVTLPSSLYYVEKNAFASCTNLAYATKQSTATVIEEPNAELLRALGGSGSGSGTGTGTGNEIGGPISGTNLTWSYNTRTFALNIRGTGAIPSYTTATPAPWAGYASSISAITVHTGVTAIGDNAFSGLTAVKDIYLPDTLTSIGTNAFSGCASLQTIRLPQSLTSIGTGVFQNCTALTIIDLPDNLTVIPERAFYGCTSLASVDLPDKLVSIGKQAFYGCKLLTLIDLPTTTTAVGEQAFYGCTGLKGVVIRSGALNIAANAFYGCTDIAKAVYVSQRPTAASGNEYLTSKLVERYGNGRQGTITWTVDRADGVLTLAGSGVVADKTGWESELPFVHTIVFGGEITAVGAELLKGNQYVQNVTLGETVTNIGNGAFEQCTKLESITFPKTITFMGTRVFYGCVSLKSVKLPATLTQIPDSTFMGCTALSSVDMGNSMVLIGSDAFRNCTALTSVTIPATVTEIKAGAFSYCSALSSVTMYGGKLLPLSTGRFDGCSALRTVYFNGSSNQWSTLSASADSTIKYASPVYCVSLTVNYVYESGPMAGETAAPSETYTGQAGTTLTVTPPTVEYHSPANEKVSYLLPSSDSTQVIKYAPTKYTLTVRFVDSETGAEVGKAQTYQLTHYEGKTLPYGENALAGYTLETPTVTIAAGDMIGDKTIDVKCVKNSQTYTINYVDTRTGEAFHTETKTVKYGADVSMTAPEVTGYTAKEPTKTYKLDDIKTNDRVINIEYNPTQIKVTIHYVDMNDAKIKDDYSATHYYGEKISIASPEITGMTPDKATVSLDKLESAQEITVKYDWRYYTVVIHFKEAGSIGYAIHDDYTTTIKHGEAFNFTLTDNESYPTPEAYVAERTTISIEAVTADVEETILYSHKNFSLVIRYTDAEGNLLESVTMTIPSGTAYTVPEKKIDGYITAESFTGTMGTKDETVTVTMDIDPEADQDKDNDNEKGGAGKVIAVIAIIVLFLGAAGALFYFLYIRRP